MNLFDADTPSYLSLPCIDLFSILKSLLQSPKDTSRDARDFISFLQTFKCLEQGDSFENPLLHTVEELYKILNIEALQEYFFVCVFFCCRWTPGEWSECSLTCGEGQMTRQVECKQKYSKTFFKRVSASACLNQTRLITVKKCQNKPCSQWEIKEWSKVIYK